MANFPNGIKQEQKTTIKDPMNEIEKWTSKGLKGVMPGNEQAKVEDSSKALRTKATYRYLDNRMIHLQAAVTISEQDIIPVSAVSQTCGYLIWEQGVPNPTNNNTVLPSRTSRAQDQHHDAASEW